MGRHGFCVTSVELLAVSVEARTRAEVALSETIRLMQEIDQVIAQHGGWPGAFAAGARQ